MHSENPKKSYAFLLLTIIWLTRINTEIQFGQAFEYEYAHEINMFPYSFVFSVNIDLL